MKYMIAKQRLKNKDRLTQKDLDSIDSTAGTFGIAPFVRKDKTDEEIYQNDRTEGLPEEAYEQEDQTISNEAPKMNIGGEVRGGGSAIRGKGFKGVF